MSAPTREERELDDAIVEVARAAQRLSDGAEGRPLASRGAPYEGGFAVQQEDMMELRAALKRWQEASGELLASTVGTRGARSER